MRSKRVVTTEKYLKGLEAENERLREENERLGEEPAWAHTELMHLHRIEEAARDLLTSLDAINKAKHTSVLGVAAPWQMNRKKETEDALRAALGENP